MHTTRVAGLGVAEMRTILIRCWNVLLRCLRGPFPVSDLKFLTWLRGLLHIIHSACQYPDVFLPVFGTEGRRVSWLREILDVRVDLRIGYA